MADDDEDRRIWKDGDPRGGVFKKDRLAWILQRKGISKAAFARSMGVSSAAVHAWISGKNHMTNAHLIKAAYVLDVPIVQLLAPEPHTRHFKGCGHTFCNAEDNIPFTHTWMLLLCGAVTDGALTEFRDPNNLGIELCKGIIRAISETQSLLPYDYGNVPFKRATFSIDDESLDALERAYKLSCAQADYARKIYEEGQRMKAEHDAKFERIRRIYEQTVKSGNLPNVN